MSTSSGPAAGAADVYPNGTETLLVLGLRTFFVSGKPVFNNGPRILPRNPHIYIDIYYIYATCIIHIYIYIYKFINNLLPFF